MLPTTHPAPPVARRNLVLAIVASALGFFVDLYDIIIVSVVRRPSLLAVGVAPGDLVDKGVWLLNVQMAGMLLGGFLWGILGDKRGRLSVLFGSIILYSAATLANGYVTTYGGYLLLRFLAGVGLSGELGAGVTLVSEQMPPKWRGIGPSLIGSFGMLGAIAGAWIGGRYDWQLTYQIGGLMGFGLLVLRFGVLESGLYENLRRATARRGSLRLIFNDRRKRLTYLSVILMGFPAWFINGVVMTFSPEIGKAMGMTDLPSVSTVFMVFFLGFTFGDFSGGFVSQALRSRKRTLRLYLTAFAVLFALYLVFARQSLAAYYAFFLGLGVAAGYTIVLLTAAAEHFGTNIRSTVTTSSLNLLRASVIPQTTAFSLLLPRVGAFYAVLVVGVCSLGISFWALGNLRETFHADLDFIDE